MNELGGTVRRPVAQGCGKHQWPIGDGNRRRIARQALFSQLHGQADFDLVVGMPGFAQRQIASRLCECFNVAPVDFDAARTVGPSGDAHIDGPLLWQGCPDRELRALPMGKVRRLHKAKRFLFPVKL